jgi:hypothetical protein
VGTERYKRALNQGDGPPWHLEWAGLTQPTTLVVEALASDPPTTTVTAAMGMPASDAAQELWIGNYSGDSSRGFDGVLDEIRIEGEVRPDDWIRAEYQFMAGGFVALQARQKLGD